MIEWVEQEPQVRARQLGQRREALPDAMARYLAASPSAPGVLLASKCRDDMQTHLSAASVEQGGLLLGAPWYESEPNAVALIEVRDAVAAPTADGTAVSLAMGTDLWQRARERAQDRWHVVGWYHSHPGLGAFFSQVDRDTQAAFFREPWHLGLVIDPLRHQAAWFRGPDSEPVEDSAVIMFDEPSA